MVAQARIFVVVQVCAIEPGQPVGIIWEMGWGPVHDHTKSGLMSGIDECHEVFRGAVAARGGKVASRLVAP